MITKEKQQKGNKYCTFVRVQLFAHGLIGTVLSLFCGDRGREKFMTLTKSCSNHDRFLTEPQDHSLTDTFVISSAFYEAHIFCYLWMQQLLLCLAQLAVLLSVSPPDRAEDAKCIQGFLRFGQIISEFLVLCLPEVMNTCVISSFMQGNNCLGKKKSSHTKEL